MHEKSTEGLALEIKLNNEEKGVVEHLSRQCGVNSADFIKTLLFESGMLPQLEEIDFVENYRR